MENFYFAQFTDIHIGTTPTPEQVAINLRWALSELETFTPRPEIILCTGDSVCNGTRAELEEFKAIIEQSPIPYIALPANHDLWGEPDDSAWREVIGPMRQSAEVGGFKFLLWNDIKRVADGWSSTFTAEDKAWLTAELEDAKARGLHVVAGVHNPPDFRSGYISACTRWTNEDTETLFRLLAAYDVKALISGDYHTNDLWHIHGVPNLNSGALSGFIWNGMDNFPVKPGYRLFHWDGRELRTFWRNGSYWNLPPSREQKQKFCASFPLYTFRKSGDMWWPLMHYERAQISLTAIGGVWTGGPRPIVRPMYVNDRTTLQVETFSQLLEIDAVSWSLNENDWRPMRKIWNGLWTQWEADFDPDEFRNGEYLLRVRADVKGETRGFMDEVPLTLCGPRNAPRGQAPVLAGPQQVRQAFRTPFD